MNRRDKPDWHRWMKDEKECKRWLDHYRQRRILRKETLQPTDYLRKAEHNIAFSNWLIEKHNDEIPRLFGEDENYYDWVITSFYYSIYHAALALISKQDITSKSHSATLCAVIYHYHHRTKELTEKEVETLGGCLEEGDIERFVRAKSLRERASYSVSRSFELLLAKEAKRNAEGFVNKVRKMVKA